MFTKDMFINLDLPPMCLCGEGYGRKIQKGGGNYIPNDVSFILFDVEIDTWWLERKNVLDISNKLNIDIVPVVGEGTLLEAINMCKSGFKSKLRDTPPEGLVLKPKVEMYNRKGERIITKIKLKDFKHGK